MNAQPANSSRYGQSRCAAARDRRLLSQALPTALLKGADCPASSPSPPATRLPQLLAACLHRDPRRERIGLPRRCPGTWAVVRQHEVVAGYPGYPVDRTAILQRTPSSRRALRSTCYPVRQSRLLSLFAPRPAFFRGCVDLHLRAVHRRWQGALVGDQPCALAAHDGVSLRPPVAGWRRRGQPAAAAAGRGVPLRPAGAPRAGRAAGASH